MLLAVDCWLTVLSFLPLNDILTMECCGKEIRNVIEIYDDLLFGRFLNLLLQYKVASIDDDNDENINSDWKDMEQIINDQNIILNNEQFNSSTTTTIITGNEDSIVHQQEENQAHKIKLLKYLRKLVHSLKREIVGEYHLRYDRSSTGKIINLNISTGANNFKILKTIHLGTIFTCTCANRIPEMKTCLDLMGWSQFSPQFDLLLFKYYTYRVLFPSYPNNVAGILTIEPKSMIPNSFYSFVFGAQQSMYEEPSFNLDLLNDRIVARFWILHYKELAKGFINNHTSLEYSLLEIRVKLSEGTITNVSLVKSVPCPKNENFKAHGGCLIL